MKKYRKKLNTKLPVSPDEDEEDTIDVHSMEVVVERVEHGLVGSLRITDEINAPMLKPGDYALLRKPAKLSKKDFVLYQSHEAYFLRRIIKYKEDDIYVAGDKEKEYHIIHKDDIVGKVISRERKNKRLSFSLTPRKRIYTFKKVNLAYFRLKNRITDYEQEINNESLELASQSAAEIKTVFENKTVVKYDIDLDSDLKDFLNPDTLVQELQDAMNESAGQEEITTEEEMIPEASEDSDLEDRIFTEEE